MAQPEPAGAAEIERALECSPILARLLVNRGVSTPEEAGAFLNPSFDQLPDPLLLPDAEAAVERIKQALHKKERIFIHGDYDSDGVTSAALWTRLLRVLGGDVQVHVPHRQRDGYDMRADFVAQAKADGVQLIITTDCGIQRCEEVEQAREAGIDVIVTDHHEPGENLPKAAAVVNPHRRDSKYPFPELAGVGVAFRLGEALIRHLGKPVDSYRRAYGDLVAIGTVTDMMPLVGDNRVIVKHGLQSLQQTKKPGIRALIAASRLGEKPLTSYSIGFGIGPRINAIGRLDDSKIALDLLLTGDEAEAARLAHQLERANEERRQEQARVLAEAMEQAAQYDITDTACLVLAAPTWNSGVIGLVAGKMAERFGRPTILIALDEESGFGRGSARSIRSFNIHDAISGCGIELPEFGGHAKAAGLAIHRDDFTAFAEAMNRIAASQLTEEDFVPAVDADMEIDPALITPALLREMARMEPWGCGNDEPVFVSRGLRIVETRRIGKDQQHLKLRVLTVNSESTDALLWQAGDLADHLHAGDSMDLCYKPQINTFNGHVSVQYVIQDFRPADSDDW